MFSAFRNINRLLLTLLYPYFFIQEYSAYEVVYKYKKLIRNFVERDHAINLS